MENKEFDKVYDIAGVIGIPALLEQTAEEAGELVAAASKFARKLRGENPTPKNTIEITNDLIGEIADILNCVECLVDAGIVSNESIDSVRIAKMERWEQRLNTVDIPGFLEKKMIVGVDLASGPDFNGNGRIATPTYSFLGDEDE